MVATTVKQDGIMISDGSVITFEAAARAFEAEGRLITGVLVDEYGDRCAAGVIGGATLTPVSREFSFTLVPRQEVISDMVRENNAFVGTPEERAVYMAAWMRSR